MRQTLMTALAISASMSGVLLDTSTGEAQRKTYVFQNPKMPSGYALDWCATWGSNCGLAAAEAYCVDIKQLDGASAYGFGGNVGQTQLVTGEYCNGWCDTFSSVTCYLDLGQHDLDAEDEE
jgi:hypothetical protein